MARARAVFLDRDGVLIEEVNYLDDPKRLRLLPWAAAAVARLREAGFKAVVISNQSGVARGYCTVEDVERFHRAIQQRLHACGAHIDGFYYCPFHPDGSVPGYAIDHEDRKPSPGMLLRAMREWPTDTAASVLIGDKQSDLEAAARAGVTGLLIETNVGDLAAAVRRFLQRRPRTGASLAAIKIYQDWIVGKALPFWAEAGFDPQHDRFCERLDWDGRAVEVPHRAMVQARQIYVFIHAAQLGWFTEGGRLAEAAMASLLRDFCTRSSGQASFAFSIGTDGRIVGLF